MTKARHWTVIGRDTLHAVTNETDRVVAGQANGPGVPTQVPGLFVSCLRGEWALTSDKGEDWTQARIDETKLAPAAEACCDNLTSFCAACAEARDPKAASVLACALMVGKRNTNPIPATLPNKGIWAWDRARVMYDRIGSSLTWYAEDGVTVDAYAVQIVERDPAAPWKGHRFAKLYCTKPWGLGGARIAH